MKNLITLIFVCSIFSASAQTSASVKTKDKNPICMERGHNLTPIKSAAARSPYTIDTKDSTITVYPAPNSGTSRCTRCGAEVVNDEKDVRVTTWRRVEKAPELVVNNPPKSPTANKVIPETVDWGKNGQRGLNLKVKSTSLNDIKKTATLRNDTLFIHKRIEPFKSLQEQVNKTTTIYYKNKPITFKTAIFDEAAFYSGKYGTDIY